VGWQGFCGAKLPARILIVADHLAARTSIRSLLDWHGFQVCGEATNGKEAIEKVIELKPDIILLDVNTPVINGVSTALEVRHIAPQAKVLRRSTTGRALGKRMANASRFIVVPVECAQCKANQRIHVAARSEIVQTANQYLSCIDSEFVVVLPDKIVGGPFPA
jgi:two-component system, chemotaxis family, chemotaxis protein CheY